jgi:3-dehydroquinate dehydratase-2
MNILVLHGPNMKFLGEREPEIYGSATLDEVNAVIRSHCRAQGAAVRIFQSDYEGGLIGFIYKNRRWADAMVINPAAYTHYSYALRDAIAASALPTAEVHMSDIKKREPFRRKSVTAEVCLKMFRGQGVHSYTAAIDFMLKLKAVAKGRRTA